MPQHLKLYHFLLCFVWLWHWVLSLHLLLTFHHMLLHFHCDSLLDHKIVQLLTLCFFDDFLLELFLHFVHLKHSWLLSLHYLNYLIPARMRRNLRGYVKECFCPVDQIRFTRFQFFKLEASWNRNLLLHCSINKSLFLAFIPCNSKSSIYRLN